MRRLVPREEAGPWVCDGRVAIRYLAPIPRPWHTFEVRVNGREHAGFVRVSDTGARVSTVRVIAWDGRGMHQVARRRVQVVGPTRDACEQLRAIVGEPALYSRIVLGMGG